MDLEVDVLGVHYALVYLAAKWLPLLDAVWARPPLLMGLQGTNIRVEANRLPACGFSP